MNVAISVSLPTSNSTTFLIQNGLFNDVDDLVKDESQDKVLLAGDGEDESILHIKSWGFGNVVDQSGETNFVAGADIIAPKRDKSLTRPGASPTLRDTEFYFTRPRPNYPDIGPCMFVDAKEWGAKGDGKTDDTSTLNHIFSAAANMSAVVYIPHGVYIIKDTVHIPVGSRVIGQSWPQMMGTGPKFEDMYDPRPVIQVGVRGNTGIVEMQSLLFTVRGPTAGAVLLQWNVYESFQGSAGIWGKKHTYR